MNNWDLLQQMIRILMQFLGGVLISRGIMTQEVYQEFTGAILSLASVGWWMFWHTNKAIVPPK